MACHRGGRQHGDRGQHARHAQPGRRTRSGRPGGERRTPRAVDACGRVPRRTAARWPGRRPGRSSPHHDPGPTGRAVPPVARGRGRRRPRPPDRHPAQPRPSRWLPERTAPRHRPGRVALSYVRRHLDVLGLTAADLATLRLRRDYVDPLGLHHSRGASMPRAPRCSATASRCRSPATAGVLARPGQPGLRTGRAGPGRAERHPDHRRRRTVTRPRPTSAAGPPPRQRSAVRAPAPAAATTWANHDYAQRVWFLTPQGLRPGWSTYVQAGGAKSYQHVVDASSGAVLFRRSTVASADGDALVYDNYPGARRGGYAAGGQLPRPRLADEAAHVPQRRQRDRVDRRQRRQRAVRRREDAGPRHPAAARSSSSTTSARPPPALCSARFVCTWNPHVAGLVAGRTGRPTPHRRSTSPATSTTTWRRRPIGFTASGRQLLPRRWRPRAAQRARRRRHRRRLSRRATTSTTRT